MRLYAFASSGTVLLAATGGIIAIVEDLVTKQALINQCTTTATGETIYSGYLGSVGSEQTLTAAQAKSYCTSAWKKTMWYDVIWLVAAVFFAVRGSCRVIHFFQIEFLCFFFSRLGASRFT